MRYDCIVIGAGIAGASAAYFLKGKGLKVLVVDRAGITVVGGSSAAGAFVSPKIGKGSPLQALTNEAFAFAREFYLAYFPDYFLQTGVIRIPKDEVDATRFDLYAPHNYPHYRWMEAAELEASHLLEKHRSFYFEEGGVCSPEVCKAMLADIDFMKVDVKALSYDEGLWSIATHHAPKLVLATGYENRFVDMRYMGVKGIWGTRGDYKSNLPLNLSMHKNVSVSANVNGVIKIGATHETGILSCIRCNEEPLKGLITKASTMVDTRDFKLIATYCGMRSASQDYSPLIGDVVDVDAMMERYPNLVHGYQPREPFAKMENLYICNGLGARGFVFGPLMGKILADFIVDGKALDPRVNPDRLFLKWCRKPEKQR